MVALDLDRAFPADVLTVVLPTLQFLEGACSLSARFLMGVNAVITGLCLVTARATTSTSRRTTQHFFLLASVIGQKC